MSPTIRISYVLFRILPQQPVTAHVEGGNYYADKLLFLNCLRFAVFVTLNTLWTRFRWGPVVYSLVYKCRSKRESFARSIDKEIFWLNIVVWIEGHQCRPSCAAVLVSLSTESDLLRQQGILDGWTVGRLEWCIALPRYILQLWTLAKHTIDVNLFVIDLL